MSDYQELEGRDPAEIIVNLATGEAQTVDPYKLHGLGMPEGFQSLESTSKLQLLEALREARAEALWRL